MFLRSKNNIYKYCSSRVPLRDNVENFKRNFSIPIYLELCRETRRIILKIHCSSEVSLRDVIENYTKIERGGGRLHLSLICSIILLLWAYSSVVERVTDNDEVHGSIPCTPTYKFKFILKLLSSSLV